MEKPTCTIDGCDTKRYGHGLCSKHYQRAKRRGELPSTKQCAIDGCTNPQKARSWCSMHWQRWQAHGTPEADVVARLQTERERFETYTVEDENGCLTWVAANNGRGYGRMRVGDAWGYPHRWAWEQVHGPIPEGMFIDHRCYNRACCNVSHLRLATNQQNGENREGAQANNKSSGVRGVTFHKATGKWIAHAGPRGTNRYVGLFATVAEAEAAVIQARAERFTHSDADHAT